MANKKYYFAWWNVENLFCEEKDPKRSDWLKGYLKSELKGWTPAVLDKKLNRLAEILMLMNQGKGPDFFGVCEVENRRVIQMLVDKMDPLNRTYEIVHHDSPDKRGIDIAFIYDAGLFEKTDKQFTYRITKRTPTRDIFQVNFKTKSGNNFVLIGNHWPARMPGPYESEPYRIIAGETLSYWIGRVLEEMGKNVPILAMGDFNDEPFSRSLTDYALSTNSRIKVINSTKSPRLYNLTAGEMARGAGTYYYSGPYVFDQLLASRGLLLSTSRLKIEKNSTRVESFKEMAYGSYSAPRRFGRPSKKSSYDSNGYSDHFPISVILEEKL